MNFKVDQVYKTVKDGKIRGFLEVESVTDDVIKFRPVIPVQDWETKKFEFEPLPGKGVQLTTPHSFTLFEQTAELFYEPEVTED